MNKDLKAAIITFLSVAGFCLFVYATTRSDLLVRISTIVLLSLFGLGIVYGIYLNIKDNL